MQRLPRPPQGGYRYPSPFYIVGIRTDESAPWQGVALVSGQHVAEAIVWELARDALNDYEVAAWTARGTRFAFRIGRRLRDRRTRDIAPIAE